MTSSVPPFTFHVHFTLAVSEGPPISLVARYGVASQVIAGLGRMLLQMREALEKEKSTETVAAETVVDVHVQKERWSDMVLVQMMTPHGIPYTFAIPTQAAGEIADRLKIESAKPTETGRA